MEISAYDDKISFVVHHLKYVINLLWHEVIVRMFEYEPSDYFLFR